jgi:ABC-2 type transport system permease protein
MRNILYLIQKEFLQIFRNKTLLPVIFGVPVIQLIIFVHATTFDLKDVKVTVVDNDKSGYSRQFINKFKGSSLFIVSEDQPDLKGAENKMLRSETDVVIFIPHHFEKKLVKEHRSEVQVLINAINAMSAGIVNGYVNSIILGLSKDIIVDMRLTKQLAGIKTINTSYAFWYNQDLNYKIYMLPGICVLLVSLVSMFLTAMNIVREKEIGTIEQINVTPIMKYQFVIGKLIPFYIIGIFLLTVGISVGRIFYHVPINGNLFLLYFVASIYLVGALGIGLFISAISDTQQQVLFVAFLFLIICIMMSGLFTPIESMPEWAQYLDLLNPFAYFIKALRMIMLKGSGFMDILREIIALSIYSVVILSLAIKTYRKRS